MRHARGDARRDPGFAEHDQRDAEIFEHIGDVVRPPLRPGEHQHARQVLVPQQLQQDGDLGCILINFRELGSKFGCFRELVLN